MGLLSASMLADLQANPKAAIPVCTILLPGSVNFRVAALPYAMPTVGQFQGKVLKWGRISRQLSDRDGGLQLSTSSLTFEDTDRTFSSAVASSGIEAIRGCAYGIAIGSPNVSLSDWFSAFVGTVDTIQMDSPFVWTVTAQSNQQQLREGKFPKTPVLQTDFPNVFDQGLYGTWVPLIYGVHDSRGSGDQGLVPCPYVDTLNFRFLVAHGWVTVDRVYLAGVLKTLTTHYTVEHETINGRLYTLVTFVSDPGEDPVTADVTGYESVGNGSGSTLTGTDALAHLLTNFIYGDYQGGNWASTTTNINSTLFTAVQTILSGLGAQKVSMRFGGDSQLLGMDAINQWCKTLRVDAFWTGLGKLGLCFNNPHDTTLWHDAPQLVLYPDELAPMRLEWDRSRLATRFMLSFLFSPAAGQFVQTLEVRDASATEDVQASLELVDSYRSLL